MSFVRPVRISTERAGAVCIVLCIAASCAGQDSGHSAPAAPDSAVVLDHVVAVVNNQAILASDVAQEMQLAVLDPSHGANQSLTPAQALDDLISRALIRQQMRPEDEQAAAPTEEEVTARIVEIRRDLPACARRNCASDDAWKAFLAAHGLTPERVQAYLRNRMEILRFIEQRFRQGIRVPPEEVEAYYRKTLLPQYAPGAEVPPLAQVAPRIEEILLQQRVNALFDDWLTNLRRQGEVEVLDSAFESEPAPAGPAPEVP
jgi:peptidyl-prolyl cis-trans isomerase SurA